MKIRTFVYTALALASALILPSCAKESDSELSMYYTTMGNVTGQQILTDRGELCRIESQECPGSIDTMQRVYMVCDILNRVEGKENEFGIRVYMLEKVKVIEPVCSSLAGDGLGEDAVMIENGWFAGGYLNMIAGYAKQDPAAGHEVNLEFDDKASTSDTLFFNLRHNASGDVPVLGEKSASKDLAPSDPVYWNAAYSFPIASIVKEYMKKDASAINIVLTDKWYTGTNLNETRVRKLSGKYLSGQFEHTPVVSPESVKYGSWYPLFQ